LIGQTPSNVALKSLGRTSTGAALAYAYDPTPRGQSQWVADFPGRRSVTVGVGEQSEGEKLFDKAVELKLIARNVAMHFNEYWQGGLFRQLDSLLDEDGWSFEDKLPESSSFKCFLRMIIHNSPKVRPGIGASHDGNIIASWTVDRDRLTVECLPNDTVRWVITKYVNGDRISGAGSSPVKLLRTYLSPYEPERWFG